MPKMTLVPTRIDCQPGNLTADVEFDDGHVVRIAAYKANGTLRCVLNVQLLLFGSLKVIYYDRVSWKDRSPEDQSFREQRLQLADPYYNGEIFARYWRLARQYIMEVYDDPESAGALDSLDTNYAYAYKLACASSQALGQLEKA